MFNIGDFVTRKSYNNDIIFRIIDIKDNLFYLKGVNVRLLADSYKEDLVLTNIDNKEDYFTPSIEDYDLLNRNDYFYLPGIILHVDGDQDYLDKCMKFYKKNHLKAYGIFMRENEMASNIIELLKKYQPDILVLTGHDSFSRKRNVGEKYKNTSSFVNAVKKAREFEKSHDKLFVVAGACQSNYENLIKVGANFASSPKRINIHALDPAIVAACLAFSDKNNNIDILKILDKTKYGDDGMGGIITRGAMYIGYPR